MLNIFTRENFYLAIKIILIYILLLLVFFYINDNSIRFIVTSLIYLLSIFIFNIEYKYGILFVLMEIGCVITESIYITFFNKTWKYLNSDIINIPYWLIPLWSTAIVLIVESVNKIKTI